jgi:hypothetical protein
MCMIFEVLIAMQICMMVTPCDRFVPVLLQNVGIPYKSAPVLI